MSENKGHIYQFGPYRLDGQTQILWNRDSIVSLPPKAVGLLTILVQKYPDVVTRQEILSTIWHDTYVEESNINYTVSQLRKALEIDNAIVTVPRIGYRFNLAIDAPTDGEDVASTTPDTAEEKALETAAGSSYRWLVVPLFLAVALFVVSFQFPFWPVAEAENAPVAVRNIRTIAVLPIVDRDAPADQSDRASLLTAEVTNRLGALSGISVRPMDAVEKLRDPKDPIVAGNTLGVDAVIAAEWLSADAGNILSVRLIDARDTAEVWKAEINIAAPNDPAMFGEVATAIASGLMKQLTDADRASLGKRYTSDPEAYLLYIRARAIFERSRPGAFEEILDNYNSAVKRDPTFALAYAGLADLFFRRGNVLEGKDSDAAYRRAESFASRAFELDPTLSQAHTAMGRVHRQLNNDLAAAEASFRQALELNPNNVFAYGYLGQILILRGEPNEAIKLTYRIAEIDPTAHPVLFLRFRGFEAMRDYASGLKYGKEAFELDRTMAYSRISYAKFLYYTGDYEKLAEVAREGLTEHKGFTFIWHHLLASAALKQGDSLAFEENFKALETGAVESTKHLYWIAVLYAEQGRIDEAFAALERCHENNEPWMAWMNTEPGFDSIRTDPRFRDILTRRKLPH